MMTIQQFLQELMRRTGAEAINLRSAAGADACDLHLFFGESVLSYRVDANDWLLPDELLAGIGADALRTRTLAGGRL
jgi:hypothetical protein